LRVVKPVSSVSATLRLCPSRSLRFRCRIWQNPPLRGAGGRRMMVPVLQKTAMPSANDSDADKTSMPLIQQFKSLDYIYWLANWMELVERFAYYGVRVIAPLFVVAAIDKGGLELTQIQKGQIWAVWAIVQSFLPILSGGFADRYGYKVNIAASTVLKIVGYFIMGYTLEIAEMLSGMPIAEARAAGTDHVYAVFFAGAMFLAAGTAIFKPGIQGLLANRISKDAAPLGWGLFYQMVNIGAFVGPLLAAYLRILNWEYVFLVCSAAIALNFIPLFMFKEPANADRDAGKLAGPAKMLLDSVRGLLEPRLFFYTIAFCGFWLMNQQFFDILPNFVDDWVDSRAAADMLKNLFGENTIPTVNGGNLTQEWMLNLNALMISFLAFLAGYATGRFGSLTNIATGIAFSIIAIFMLMGSLSGWWVLACIAVYSIGEMTAAPSNFRYLNRIAPEGKKGLYMGYSNFTVGIGWSIGSLMAGHLYANTGEKVGLARRHLVDKLDMDSAEVLALPKSDVLPMLQEKLGLDEFATRQLLWDTYDPYWMWLVFGSIGCVSLVALLIYNYFVNRADKDPSHPFNTRGDFFVKVCLVPICVILVAASVMFPSTGIIMITLFFIMMAIMAFTQQKKVQQAG
jgi:MFS family permease